MRSEGQVRGRAKSGSAQPVRALKQWDVTCSNVSLGRTSFEHGLYSIGIPGHLVYGATRPRRQGL